MSKQQSAKILPFREPLPRSEHPCERCGALPTRCATWTFAVEGSETMVRRHEWICRSGDEAVLRALGADAAAGEDRG